MCIPNTVKAGIQNARDDFFRLANDLVSGTSTKKSGSEHGHTVKYPAHDYQQIQGFEISPASRPIAVAAALSGYSLYKSIWINPLEKPPQA